MYHDIIPPGKDKSWSGLNLKGANAYKISSEVFENQVAYAAEFRDKTGREIIFSFDDGGISGIKTIAPILERYQFKGIFFIPTAFIGLEGFLSGTDIKVLHENGHIIGSHSHTHPTKMNRMSYEDIAKEWQISRSILNEITSSLIDYASVPGGWYSRKVAEACNGVGIKCLFSSEPTQKNYYVKRCLVSGRLAIRDDITPRQFENLLNERGLTREWLWLKWALGRILKLAIR